jgi:hypothetical protein
MFLSKRNNVFQGRGFYFLLLIYISKKNKNTKWADRPTGVGEYLVRPKKV